MLTQLAYPQPIEAAIKEIEGLLLPEDEEKFHLSKRSLALLLLQRDPSLWETLEKHPQAYEAVKKVIENTQQELGESPTAIIVSTRQKIAWELEKNFLQQPAKQGFSWANTLHQVTVNPITGFPLLVLILYYGVYKFVGEFGAGTLVDSIETFFETYINPTVNQVVAFIFPWQAIQDLFGNDYGIITLGIRYATAIVLPVVATFFLMFSLLEDSGYLPRLSLMLDRLFKSIGLSGKSVIPIVLGFGCDTMATLVTRTLETKRERLIATFLLSLTIPCAAQWGVIVGLLSQNPKALLFWGGFMVVIFMASGFLLAKLLPGKQAGFYLEIPPLRLPHLKNILTKTYLRLKWYFLEILPLFIWASVLIWLGQLTGLFELIISWIEPLTLALGLPKEAAPIFLYGFFRRDYGAAGLFDLQQDSILNGNQLVIAAIVLTLFLPCIAQLQIMIKERGAKITTAMVLFIFPFAFLVGYLVNISLTTLGVNF